MTIQKLKCAVIALSLGTGILSASADVPATNTPPEWLTHPLSLAEATDIALRQNGDILHGKSELQAQYGVVVQTRAIVLPKLSANGYYEYTKEVQTFPVAGFGVPEHLWNADIQLTQTIYQGGQLNSALRSAKLTKEQALLQYQTVIADSLLLVRIAYYNVLQAQDQVVVEEASVKLLTNELDDQKRRFEAGTVPQFNVLRADVELGNERPKLIQARNSLRVGKNNLVTLLGYNVPVDIWEDIPLQLTDKLDAEPYEIDLPKALTQALQRRTELASLRKAHDLRKEGIVNAKAGYRPTVQIFGAYGAQNSEFFSNPAQSISGPSAGIQFSWNIFDGLLTQGKIKQANSLFEESRVDVDNETRNIELEVRTDYSNFIEARETLESQTKVQEEADEALRLATARNDAGTGTQLDVLSAQTSLTQARSTQVQALRDYDVARARLERAIGITFQQTAQAQK